MTLVQRLNHEFVNEKFLTLSKLPKDTVSNMNAITVVTREKQVISETVKESSSTQLMFGYKLHISLLPPSTSHSS